MPTGASGPHPLDAQKHQITNAGQPNLIFGVGDWEMDNVY
jgi:hypothetical protein